MKRLLRSTSRGFTAVEVLSAMTLFAIGAAGVISMQRVSIQGNADARRFDIGSEIGAEWLARLRRDSMTWTEPNSTFTTNNVTTKTLWLKNTTFLPTPLPQNTGWQLPGPVPTDFVGSSYAFDVLGRELPAGSADTFFCVNYRLDWLQPDPVNAGVGLTLRAEVRVFWPRFEQPQPENCLPDGANGAGPARYHFLYLATTIRRNAQ